MEKRKKMSILLFCDTCDHGFISQECMINIYLNMQNILLAYVKRLSCSIGKLVMLLFLKMIKT